MGKIVVRNQPCLDKVGCGSSDARQIYEGGTSFCFSCQTFFKEDVFTDLESYQMSAVTLDDIKSFTSKGFKERGITRQVCEFFGVKAGFSTDGAVSDHYYPYSNGGYKHRKLPKSFSWIGPPNGLFGKDLFTGGGKRLVITEGELDALSVAQASQDRYGKIYPVISIASSVATADLLENRDWIRSFGEVVLCLDNDKAGQEATQKAIKIIGVDKVKLWKPGDCKDASEVLVKKGHEILNTLIWDAEKWCPAGIISKEAIWQQIIERQLIPSIPYPPCLAGVNSKIKGMRFGEIALFISGTGCHGKGTEILMYDGSIKLVEDVIEGDVLMGDDNTPRNVLRLCRGHGPMFEVSIRGKDKFTCNSEHILSVVNNDNEGRWGLHKDQIIDVKLTDYLEWSDKRKHLSKSFKSGRLEFVNPEPLPLHPYLLGVWLGDGYSENARLSNEGDEILEKLIDLNVPITKHETKYSWGLGKDFNTKLKNLNLIKNKHIPELYLKSSIKDRLELLAGLLDTDGTLTNNCYEFSQKSIEFTKQFIRLANSLGYQATHSEQKVNKFGICQRVWISGERLNDIPVAIQRKKAKPRTQIKNPLRFKTEIKPIGFGDYYGFELDGNHRYVLGNFLVTHNSGKSTITREIELHVIETTEYKVGVISLEESPGETGTKLAGMALRKNPEENEISNEELKTGFDAVFKDDRVIVLDHQGAIKDDSIVSQLEYMCLVGCKFLIIDHITILVSEGSDGLSGNEAIDKTMNDLLRLVKRHNVWIGLVSHLRKVPNGSTPFEGGKLPTMDDIRGSGSIKQVSFDIIAFARNMVAEDELDRNTIKMAVLKSRTVGKTGPVMGAVYSSKTGRLTACDENGELFF